MSVTRDTTNPQKLIFEINTAEGTVRVNISGVFAQNIITITPTVDGELTATMQEELLRFLHSELNGLLLPGTYKNFEPDFLIYTGLADEAPFCSAAGRNGSSESFFGSFDVHTNSAFILEVLTSGDVAAASGAGAGAASVATEKLDATDVNADKILSYLDDAINKAKSTDYKNTWFYFHGAKAEDYSPEAQRANIKELLNNASHTYYTTGAFGEITALLTFKLSDDHKVLLPTHESYSNQADFKKLLTQAATHFPQANWYAVTPGEIPARNHVLLDLASQASVAFDASAYVQAHICTSRGEDAFEIKGLRTAIRTATALNEYIFSKDQSINATRIQAVFRGFWARKSSAAASTDGCKL